MRAPASVVDAVIASLQGDAPGWHFTVYEAEHVGLGLKVWIANEYYGLHLTVCRITYWPGIGLLRFLDPRVRRLRHAVLAAAERRALAAFSKRWGEQ